MDSNNDNLPRLEPWPTEPEKMPANLKKRINNLLWVSLPPNVTLDEADALACDIHMRIHVLWDKFAASTPTSTPSTPKETT